MIRSRVRVRSSVGLCTCPGSYSHCTRLLLLLLRRSKASFAFPAGLVVVVFMGELVTGTVTPATVTVIPTPPVVVEVPVRGGTWVRGFEKE